MTQGDSNETVFDKIQNHEAREVLDEKLKFRWRYTTLQNDFRDVKYIREIDVPHTTERSQQLETQDYVFEVERRLHHYLSGLYSLSQQQLTLQNGVGQSFRDDLKDVKSNYMRKESSRTVLGLRHYVQHENVLPLEARSSNLDGSTSLVIMVDDLHREDDDRDFEQHFGHIEKPYLEPTEWIIENWDNVSEFYNSTVEVMEEHTEEEITELMMFREEVDDLFEQMYEDYLNFGSDGS